MLRSESKELCCIQDGLTVDLHDVAAHTQTGNCFGQTYGFLERSTVGHQRGGSHDSMRVRFDDGAIDTRGEAKVICIDDQSAHRVSLAGKIKKAELLRQAVVVQFDKEASQTRDYRVAKEPFGRLRSLRAGSEKSRGSPRSFGGQKTPASG